MAITALNLAGVKLYLVQKLTNALSTQRKSRGERETRGEEGKTHIVVETRVTLINQRHDKHFIFSQNFNPY